MFRLQTVELDDEQTQWVEVATNGHSLLVRRAKFQTTEVIARVWLPDGRQQDARLKFGEGWRFAAFDKVELKWEAQDGQWIELATWGSPERLGDYEPEIYVSLIPPDAPPD